MSLIDRTLRTHEKTVRRWKAGDVPQPAALELPPAAAADHRYVETIHDTIRHLVALEAVGGGDEVAPIAARSFQSVRRRLAAGNHPRHL
ncbi:MAG TPA: hypothetical protein VIC57_04410, partial [Candidatus Dormibacteraeota bacterium]